MTSHDEGTQAAKTGEDEFKLAMRYENGDGVTKDVRESIRHLQRAVSLNHTGAMVKLGKAYQFGLGVECDINKAVRLFKKAASLGNRDALVEIAQCCSKDSCTEANKMDVIDWCIEQANEGH